MPADISTDATVSQMIRLPAHTVALLDTLPFDHVTRIADIGANPANRPAYANLCAAGGAEVFGFEPGAEAFARLMADKGPHEQHFQEAVGNGRQGTFYVCENGSFSSVFAPDNRQIDTLGHWEKSLTVVDKVKLKTTRLDGIKDMPQPDMLKMDTQGSELRILEGGTKSLGRAVVVMPELRFFQLYKNEPMLGPVDQKLRDMGFMLHKILPGAQVRLTSSKIDRLRPAMTRNQMVDADGIYIRDLAKSDDMDNSQLAHLALLADSVFVSMDVVLRCLDLLVARDAISPDFIDTYIDALPRNFRVAED